MAWDGLGWYGLGWAVAWEPTWPWGPSPVRCRSWTRFGSYLGALWWQGWRAMVSRRGWPASRLASSVCWWHWRCALEDVLLQDPGQTIQQYWTYVALCCTAFHPVCSIYLVLVETRRPDSSSIDGSAQPKPEKQWQQLH